MLKEEELVNELKEEIREELRAVNKEDVEESKDDAGDGAFDVPHATKLTCHPEERSDEGSANRRFV